MIINKVAEKRKELGITQDQLSRDCEVTTRTIQSLEKNNYNCSIEIAFKLKKALKCNNIEELFKEDI